MEERNNEIYMQSPGRRYLAMPGKMLLTVLSIVFHAIEQEKTGVA